MLIACVQTGIVHSVTGLSTVSATADSFIFNFVFACLSLFLWYPICYIRWKNNAWYCNLFIHIILAGLLLTVWSVAGYAGMYFLSGGDRLYVDFLNASLYLRFIEGLFFYVLTVLVFYIFMYIDKLNETVDNEIRLNRLIKDGELNLLKSQINPHFLFNSLNSVNAMIIRVPEQAGEMLVALSDYLRYTVLSTKKEKSTLSEEIGNIERYLSIEKLRFGERLNYEFDTEPECLGEEIPTMLLQPIFENAVKHGVYESVDAVWIRTVIKRSDNCLLIRTENDYDPENSGERKGSGTGLKNVKERLNLTYGTDAFLQTESGDGRFVVLLKIPTT